MCIQRVSSAIVTILFLIFGRIEMTAGGAAESNQDWSFSPQRLYLHQQMQVEMESEIGSFSSKNTIYLDLL